MATAKTDLHDPRIRTLGILAGSVVYAAIVLPALHSASAASLFGVAAVALLTVAVVFSERLPTNADRDGSTDESPNVAVTIGASLGAILLFQFCLGALAPALRDAIGGALLLLVVGGFTGLLVGGTFRTVTDVVG